MHEKDREGMFLADRGVEAQLDRTQGSRDGEVRDGALVFEEAVVDVKGTGFFP